jgi:hypothetical protein
MRAEGSEGIIYTFFLRKKAMHFTYQSYLNKLIKQKERTMSQARGGSCL